jgi:hypothetical protein
MRVLMTSEMDAVHSCCRVPVLECVFGGFSTLRHYPSWRWEQAGNPNTAFRFGIAAGIQPSRTSEWRHKPRTLQWGNRPTKVWLIWGTNISPRYELSRH